MRYQFCKIINFGHIDCDEYLPTLKMIIPWTLALMAIFFQFDDAQILTSMRPLKGFFLAEKLYSP